MGSSALNRARDKMVAAGVDEVAIETFAHYFRLLEHGETGMIPESAIEPLDMESLADVEVSDEDAAAAIRTTAVIKLNGGLGTSMGMDRAKSLLCVRRGLSFLDIIARQVLHLRSEYDATAAADLHEQLPHLGRHHGRAGALRGPAASTGCRWSSCRTRSPSSWSKDLAPVSYPKDPDLEWCPPGHGDLYTALRGTGLLDRLIDAGYERVFVSNSDNLGAVPGRPGRRLVRRRPVRRSRSRRCGVRRPTARAATSPAARSTAGSCCARPRRRSTRTREALADLDRHRFCSTNNLWFDLRAMQRELDRRGGILGLPLIRNVKNVDPADPKSAEVIQIETAMGAAIEVFDGARTIEVGRDRFVPVKTTNDLLVLRSDVYDLGKDFVLDQAAEAVPVRRPRRGLLQARRRVRQAVPRGRAVDEARRPRCGSRATGPSATASRSSARSTLESRLRPAGGRRDGAQGWLTTSSSVEEHLARILDAIEPLAAYPQPLMEALGLAAAEDVVAPISLPSFDNSAMDGYAVAFADVGQRLARTHRCTCRWSARSAPARPSCSRCRPAPPSRS